MYLRVRLACPVITAHYSYVKLKGVIHCYVADATKLLHDDVTDKF